MSKNYQSHQTSMKCPCLSEEALYHLNEKEFMEFINQEALSGKELCIKNHGQETYEETMKSLREELKNISKPVPEV